MNLRTRLYLILGALFLVPILVGGLILVFVVPDVRNDRVRDSVRGASAAMQAEIAAECQQLSLASTVVALASSALPPARLFAPLHGNDIDYAALLAPDGSVRDSTGGLPAGVDPAALPDCVTGKAVGPVLSRPVDVAGGSSPGLRAVTARVLDTGRLNKLAVRTGPSNIALLLAGGRLVAHSGPDGTARAVASAAGGRTGQFSVSGWSVSALPPAGNTPFTVVVASRENQPGTTPITLFALILVAGALAAGVLVTSVARSLSRPFAELTEMAERVAKGDLNAQLERVHEGEAGRLGEAFNRMTSNLRKNMTALEQSHDDLRESLERIGDTLARTHDLEGLLRVVLETAVATLHAEAGIVLYGAPDQLRVIAEQRLAEAGLAAPTGISVGAGVLGGVLATGDSVRGQLGSAGLTPSRTEPGSGEILATPLRSMGVVTGVVALYGHQDTRPFDSADEDALRTLTSQASTAIDNVQLHQEAQRLSTTDGLTGLWNFRYLSMSLAREIERSTRFDRPLAVLMLDLDHFKAVNDTHGHARGDSVLRELANRVQEQIREVDTFARYGGEEFVVVLPETTIDGAAQLAERVCLAVRRQPFGGDGEESLAVTVSIGVAAFPQHGASAATLMRAADKALYVAKHEGRDRWHVAGEGATAGVGH